MKDAEFRVLEALYMAGGRSSAATLEAPLQEPLPSGEGQAPSTRLSALCQIGYLIEEEPGKYGLTFQGRAAFLNALAERDPESPIVRAEQGRRPFLVNVEVEPLEEGGYLAICTDIQGCHAEGNTVAESLENLEDVARVILEVRKEHSLPLADSLVAYNPGEKIHAQLLVLLPE